MSAAATIERHPMRDAANSYAARGWCVFPVPAGTKRSHKSAERSGGRNWGNTTDPAEIAADFARWPNANVGIVCGKESGCFVIERDTIEGHGVDGVGNFERLLAEHGPLPETIEAVSPSGSIHSYFAWPEGWEIASSASRIAPGVDVRGEGGMVLAPPSVKPGAPLPYRWIRPPGLFDLAECPEWLLQLCIAKSESTKKPVRAANDTHADDDRVLGYLYTRPNDLSRDDWVRLCLALKHRFGDRARDGWIAFSNRYAGGVTPGEAERQWETAKPRGDVDIGTAVHLLGGHDRRHSGFQTGEAWRETIDPETGEISEGPESPEGERYDRGGAKGGADQRDQFLHPYARFHDTEPAEFRATEFVIDGAIVAGAVMLAGGWGAGKTTQLVPLLFRAAHLCQPDDPLKPLLRRRVIYVTEDVDQVRQIIRSMRVAGELDGIPTAEVADYFKIVSAARLKAEDIVLAAKVYEGLETINRNPDNGREYAAQAVVVFDTRSAAIALDDENDNTEAAQVIATLRQGMPANPTIIVGHIAKALKKADVADLSGRGGGAWEADAQQVLYLVNDDGERWLDVKHRFVSAIDGIRFTSCANETSATDPLGNTVTVRLMHGKPEAVDLGGRAIEKQRKKEEEAQAAANALRMRIMQQARKWRNEGTGLNRQRIKEGVAGRGAQLTEIIADLIAEDWLLELPIPKEQRRNNKQAHYLAVLSPDERDEYRETGAIPAFALIPPKSMVKS